MIGDKILYQFGDALEDYYIFAKYGLNYTLKPGVKTIRETSAIYDGESRINNTNANFKTDYILEVVFTMNIYEQGGINYLNKIFGDRKIRKIFLYEKDLYNQISKFYFNWAEVVEPPTQVNEEQESLGLENRKYSTKIRFLTPYFYECDDNLRYFSATDFEANKLYWSSTAIPGQNNSWGNTTVPKPYWGKTYLSAFPKVSTLNANSQSALFDIALPKSPLQFKDRILAREDYTFASTGIFTTTLTTNNATTTNTSGLNLNTTSENRLFRLKFSALGQNETISIKNISNNSDILITWNYQVANTNDIEFNSYWGTFFDTVTGKEINTSYISWDYTLDSLLYFSDLNSINPYSMRTTDNLILQKNTSSNNTITIQNLKTNN
jgi:hypothetical protein